MANEITRRNFIKGAAAAAIAVVVGSVFEFFQVLYLHQVKNFLVFRIADVTPLRQFCLRKVKS